MRPQADFLKANIKVAGKAGNLGDAGACRPAPGRAGVSDSALSLARPLSTVTVTSTSSTVTVTSNLVTKDNAAVAAVSKRYLRVRSCGVARLC